MSLSKVKIEARNDKAMRGSVVKTFELPVNPESYTQNYKVEYNTQRGQGNQGTAPRFNSTAPEELRLDFFFDGTQTIENYGNKTAGEKQKYESVQDELKDFLDTVYLMEGEIHRPRFLQITWGTLLFSCILKNLDINYTLFKADGKPLRVKIAATFLNYIAQEERVAREKKKSPDLTRIRNAKQGERLDLMTSEVYNTPQYVLQIAKANNLSSIRQLKQGQELRFPPLDKTEK
jgi:Contractile injection system tube protein